MDALEVIHERYADLKANPASRTRTDQEFHLALAGLAGNALLLEMLRGLYDRLNFRRRSDGYYGFWSDRGLRGEAAAREHAGLLGALRRGDRDAALGALRGHLTQAQANYEQFIASVEADEGETVHPARRARPPAR